MTKLDKRELIAKLNVISKFLGDINENRFIKSGTYEGAEAEARQNAQAAVSNLLEQWREFKSVLSKFAKSDKIEIKEVEAIIFKIKRELNFTLIPAARERISSLVTQIEQLL